MANEDKKDFNAMLHDNKDMPKFQIITDQKSIEKYGGSKMYFAPPIDYDRVMKKVPYGKVITVPSFFLISSAVDGNENAIEKLLLFYEAYISKCCLRPFYDEYGNVYIVVDMELKGRIREALLKMICEFEIDEH